MKIKIGSIFASEHGDFYQVIKTTPKTVTIRPIERTFVGYADPYGWVCKYMPIPNRFTTDPWMGREGSEQGKRLKIRDYSRDGNMPELELAGRIQLLLWDGTPSIWDRYN